MIWALAIADDIVSTDPESDGFRSNGASPKSALSAINVYTRSLVGRPLMRAILFNRSGGRCHAQLDCDTIKIADLKVPVDTVVNANGSMQSPIVKLLTASYSTFLHPSGHRGKGPDNFWDHYAPKASIMRRTACSES